MTKNYLATSIQRQTTRKPTTI